jgi:hypothetical protein
MEANGNNREEWTSAAKETKVLRRLYSQEVFIIINQSMID